MGKPEQIGMDLGGKLKPFRGSISEVLFKYYILPSSVKLAIAIATEVALLSLFPTTNTTRKSINKASYEANFQYATLLGLVSWWSSLV